MCAYPPGCPWPESNSRKRLTELHFARAGVRQDFPSRGLFPVDIPPRKGVSLCHLEPLEDADAPPDPLAVRDRPRCIPGRNGRLGPVTAQGRLREALPGGDPA